MILVINGTNRPGSRSSIVSKYCVEYLTSKGITASYLGMEDIPEDFLHSNMYNHEKHTASQVKMQDDLVIPNPNWLIVSPEYNGSFPGVLKLFFDGISTRKYAETFAGHNAGLIGVAAGRAGNLRGMEHLTGLLNYLKVTVFPNKLPLSSIGGLIVEDQLTKEAKETINGHLDAFLAWIER